MTLALGKDELQAFLMEVFPEVMDQYQVDDVTETTVRMRLKVRSRDLRPGGTVSGPAMFSLADVAVYAMVLARIGREALTVTTNASIDFMRKPEAGRDLIAECRLLKLGRVLAVCDVLIHSEGSDGVVARSSMTYSIPPVKVG
ncbi:PaaI family thioesterase [Chachezhania sediminis]|uniref:PaaI family thioesterase n=1 Tax=Chachezhania sediminis TaxID=2599291 RepID=UPI00131BA65A|nr:PaaI family thioesterase [Chachezhania sediminis]